MYQRQILKLQTSTPIVILTTYIRVFPNNDLLTHRTVWPVYLTKYEYGCKEKFRASLDYLSLAPSF